MGDSHNQRSARDVKWSARSGLRLKKRFGGRSNVIEIARLGGDVLLSVPETAIDQLVTALLELKVLMKDGRNYNSGTLRLAVVDGSGIEAPVAELNENGRHNVRSLATQLIAEIEETETRARMSIDRELDLASNMFGRLPPESRQRLRAVYENPTEETWDAAYTLILERHTHTSLWQAVIAVDPTFPQVGPSTDGRGNQISSWARIPDRDLIRRALVYATH